jgi:hypothetical protein
VIAANGMKIAAEGMANTRMITNTTTDRIMRVPSKN